MTTPAESCLQSPPLPLRIQISYVGYEHVDHDTVSDAIAGQTLFIHGSRVDEGSGASITATAAAKKGKKKKAKQSAGDEGGKVAKTQRRRRRWRRLHNAEGKGSAGCSTACGSEEPRAGLPDGTSTVCDPTCGGGGDGSRFGGFLCGAGNSDLFGDMCRLCYVCPRAARNAQLSLRTSFDGVDAGEERAVIMCDTMEPPPEVAAADSAACSEKCNRKKGTVSRLVSSAFCRSAK